MHRWIGRLALVTGASTGIGAEICKVLVGHGVNVVGCARNVERIENLATSLSFIKPKGKLHAIRCDLSRESEILSMFKQISNSYGHIDICINNAGINHAKSTLLDGLTENWRHMLEVNVLAPAICTREAIKSMAIENDQGQIINISSLCDREIPKNSHDMHFFSGTKCMLTTLTKGLRLEVKPNIRVSSISPGLVKTDFVETCWGSEMANIVYRDNKYLTPTDIAEAVVFILASPPHVEVTELLVRAVERTA